MRIFRLYFLHFIENLRFWDYLKNDQNFNQHKTHKSLEKLSINLSTSFSLAKLAQKTIHKGKNHVVIKINHLESQLTAAPAHVRENCGSFVTRIDCFVVCLNDLWWGEILSGVNHLKTRMPFDLLDRYVKFKCFSFSNRLKKRTWLWFSHNLFSFSLQTLSNVLTRQVYSKIDTKPHHTNFLEMWLKHLFVFATG